MVSRKEEYKLTVLYNKKRYAVIAHSVEKDESIYVRSRKKIKKTILKSSGTETYSNGKIGLAQHTIAQPVGNQLHYHTTGVVNRKEDNRLIKIDKFYPLLSLQHPIALLKISAPNVEWFDEAKKDKNEHVIDLEEIKFDFKRLDFQIWIGPKGSFSHGLRPQNTYASLVFTSGLLCDVAYFIREMDELEESLKETTITSFPETKMQYDKAPLLEPWVSCIVVCRQVREFIQQFAALNNASTNEKSPSSIPKLFTTDYHTRMSICSNGVIGAIGSKASLNGFASLEFKTFALQVEDILKMLIQRGEGSFIDISECDNQIPPNTLFIRVNNAETDTMQHEMVIVAIEQHKIGYYELPNILIKKVKECRQFWVEQLKK